MDFTIYYTCTGTIKYVKKNKLREHSIDSVRAFYSANSIIWSNTMALYYNSNRKTN